MSAIITRADLDRIGVTRKILTDALRCCLIRIRRGLYIVRPGCRQPAHAHLARFGIDFTSDRGAGRSLALPDGAAAVERRPRTSPESQYAADLADVEKPGLRGHCAKLRILVRTYATSLSGDSALSHVSAALLWGLPLTRPIQNRAEAIRADRSRSYAKCIIRQRSLRAEDVTVIGGIRVTTPARTLLDIATDYPLDVSVPMIDHALRAGLLKSSSIAELPAHTFGRRGVSRARTAFSLADPVRESPAESICAVRFHELAIDGFEPQITFRNPDNRALARVDFLHRESRVIVEVNGEIKYSDGEAGARRARRDRERDYQLRNLHYRVFQLSWADLFRTRVFQQIKQAVDHPDRR